ncbi:hypothetical protein V5N11_023349 [Cardamine amara subsp. amara]|uniref:Uncharacterized protein n=1 Tax=Cardamine amara subsp. amara TaxID=228776 RepID=A0ABD1AX50_CARAN
MAKISFLIFVVALIAFLHAYEAHRVGSFREALGKDLHKAETMIEKDLKAKKANIQGLKSEVKTLSKSEVVLKELEKALNEKKLRKFSRTINMKKRRFERGHGV